jgi:hypothetical protein
LLAPGIPSAAPILRRRDAPHRVSSLIDVPRRARTAGNPEFPEGLRTLIRECIPGVDAAELLLLLARAPEVTFELGTLISSLRGTDLSEASACAYLARFEACGLVAEEQGRYRFSAGDEQVREWVSVLERLYNERPVTLIRTIYALREDRPRAFADAFKIKKP